MINSSNATDMNIKKLKLFPGLSAALLAAILGHESVIVTATAQDAVPRLVNYQGRLTDGAGQPLSNGFNPRAF